MKKDNHAEGDPKTGLTRRNFIKTTGILAGSVALAGHAFPSIAAGVRESPIYGAFDFHVHGAPDVIPRSLDFVELARAYRDAGARGFMLFHHQAPTAQMAYLIRKTVPEIDVVGMLALNNYMGGLNPAGVEMALKFTDGYLRAVKLPTQSSGHHLACEQKKKDSLDLPGIWVIDKNGNVVPELMEIIKMVAKADITLMTGHVSPKESIAVIKAAREAGVKKMVLNHPNNRYVRATRDEQRQIADMGAYMEHNYIDYLQKVPIETFVEDIKTIGAERCIVATDMGQALNPVPPEAFKDWVKKLSAKGITKEEMDLMIRKNPIKLVGLDKNPL